MDNDPTPDAAGQPTPALTDAEIDALMARPEFRAIVDAPGAREARQRLIHNDRIAAAGGTTGFLCEDCDELAGPQRWYDHSYCDRHYRYEVAFADGVEWQEDVFAYQQHEREWHDALMRVARNPPSLEPSLDSEAGFRAGVEWAYTEEAERPAEQITRASRRRGIAGDPNFISLAVAAYRKLEEHYDRPTDHDLATELGLSRATFRRALSDHGKTMSDIRRLAREEAEK